MRVRKHMAIGRLNAAGYDHIARLMQLWCLTKGNDKGWNGWLNGNYPELTTIVWGRQ